MRLLAILLLLIVVVSAVAQPTTTTISDTLYNSVGGGLFSGSVTIQGPNGMAAGVPFFGSKQVVQVHGGAFSVALVPNDTAAPSGTTYQMTFSSSTGGFPSTDTKTCTVPTSSTPITLAAANCVDGTQQASPATIALSQISPGGAAAGQGMCFNGTYWAPGNCGGGSGGSGSVNYGVNSVACSSSPTFNLKSSLYSVQSVSLTCNISSMSFQNLAAGALVTFRFCRGVSIQTFSGWPGTVHGGMTNANPAASTCDSQSFYSPDGTNLYSNGPGVLNQP